MSNIPCPVERCDRPRPGHRPMCGACEAELFRALAAVPELEVELETTRARQTSHSAGEVPALTGEGHVHLWVFTPSEQGGFPEYDVPPTEPGTEVKPGAWCWPGRG